MVTGRKFLRWVLMVFLVVVSTIKAKAQQQDGEEENFRLIAHRGGVVDDQTAENSLAAMEKAVAAGYWMIEIDLRITKDSILITHHDRNFERYYGRDVPVNEMTWDEIRKLKGDKGNRVLKFEEALDFCQKNGLEVMVDNKIRGFDPDLFTHVVELLEKYDLKERAFMIGTEESTEFFTGKIKLSCTRQQLEDNMKKPHYDPEHYYLFSGQISEADYQWARENNILPVGVINSWGIRSEDKIKAAKVRAEKLKASGVKYFQIDSVFDEFF